MDHLLPRHSFAVAFFAVAMFFGLGQTQAQAAPGELRPVRATVGVVEYRNWHIPLVRQNPNLAHFHWNPIYANVQGTRLVGPPPPPIQRLTTRPKKECLNNKPAKHQLAAKRQNVQYIYHPLQERPSVYKHAVHMPPQMNTKTSIAYKHVAPGMRNTNTSLAYKHVAPGAANRDMMGRLVPQHRQPQEPPITAMQAELMRKQLMAKLNPPQPEALVARQKKLQLANKNVNGTLSHKDCNGQLTHKSVEGQLVARAVSATFTRPDMDYTSAYVPYSRGDGSSQRSTKTAVDGRVYGSDYGRNY